LEDLYLSPHRPSPFLLFALLEVKNKYLKQTLNLLSLAENLVAGVQKTATRFFLFLP
jgi:hypothetical protein